VFSPRTRLILWLVALAEFALLLGCSWARYSNVHQHTFDLALYTRVAWGLVHGDLWASVINAPALGTHLAPVLLPLGLLGAVLGTVPVLLVAQASAIALCLFPIARIGARRLGTRGVWLAGAAFVLYPNLFHVGSYEFHPGTLAVLPMSWAFDALDRNHFKQLALCCVGVLMCREDLGAFCVLVLLVFFFQQRDRRALYACLGCLVYTVAALAIISAHAPQNGSLDAHFSQWGGSPLGVLGTLLREPERVVAHFRERLSYLPRVLAPLSFFSLRAPRLLLPALPYLALNLLSGFPTADEQYSHYLTPAVPALIVSGVVGVTAVNKDVLRALWFATLGIAHHALGGSPLSRDFERAAFVADASTAAARKVLARIPSNASVQAPDALLSHLAERHDVRRAPPPESGSEFTVLDVSHRQRYARKETLLRTSEEPLVRAWLARRDQALWVYAPPYALFARSGVEGQSAEATSAARGASDSTKLPCVQAAPSAATPGAADTIPTRPLTSCLANEGASLRGLQLRLRLRAFAPCPADLALRFGPDAMPARVELLCDGALSPARLRAGDVIVSDYTVTPREAQALYERGLFIGALRASGAPVAGDDPAAIPVHLQHSGM
jgi:uncharacterized membrane protein